MNRLLNESSLTTKYLLLVLFAAATGSFSLWFISHRPENKLTFVIILVLSIAWFFRSSVTKSQYCVLAIVVHWSVVTFFHPDKPAYLTYVCLAVLLPVLGFWLTTKSVRKTFFFPLLAILVTCCLLGDIFYAFSQSASLFMKQVHPGRLINVNTTLQSPSFFAKRLVSPPYDKRKFPGQAMRYLSLLYRKPYVFSPRYYRSQELIYDGRIKLLAEIEPKDTSFETSLRTKRWNSFFLLKSYHELIHSGWPVASLKSVFGVSEDIIQFKKSVQPLARLGPEQLLSIVDAPLVDTTSFQKLSVLELPKNSKLDEANFSYEVQNYTFNSLKLLTQNMEKGFLYWADGYDKHWEAYVDGKQVPIYRANRNFKLIQLDAGTHEVVFSYNPRLFKAALMLFYLLFLVALLSAIWLWWNQRTTCHRAPT